MRSCLDRPAAHVREGRSRVPSGRSRRVAPLSSSGALRVRATTPLGDSVLLEVLGPGQARGARPPPSRRAAERDDLGARGRRDALGLPRRLRPPPAEPPRSQGRPAPRPRGAATAACERAARRSASRRRETRVRRRVHEPATSYGDRRRRRGGSAPRRTWPRWQGRRGPPSTACCATRRRGDRSGSSAGGSTCSIRTRSTALPRWARPGAVYEERSSRRAPRSR